MAKKPSPLPVTIIGGGLAGTEATYQLVRRGIPVKLYEMRPKISTEAHQTDQLAELVCSNSLGSNLPDRASGLLKEEMRAIGSYILDTAYKYRIPAGQALAVDRDAFSREITRYVKGHSLVTFMGEEADAIPEEGMVIIATGPLTSDRFLKCLQKAFGQEHLYFFDAIAPIVAATSINMESAFRADRYGAPGQRGDYINCPMDREEYEAFVAALVKAERIPIPEFEKDARKKLFTACQPVEEIAAGGPDSLRFGPMKPVGLTNPKTTRRPYAVVQLRQDNLLGNMFNIVGFQTNLKHSEQERVFRMIPALREAQFLRLGQMHKNIYLNSPALLTTTLQTRTNPDIFLAGQLTGAEGYTESAAMGMLAGFNAARISLKKEPVAPPPESILGALLKYITYPGHKSFQPMNAGFGLFDLEGDLKDEADRRQLLVARARKSFRTFMDEM